MSTFIGSIESFSESKNEFNTYIERFEQLMIVNQASAEKKLPLFITFIGSETYSVLKDLCTPSAPSSKTYIECVELLKSHYNPKKIVSLERFKFYKRDQKQNESFSDYVVHIKNFLKHVILAHS